MNESVGGGKERDHLRLKRRRKKKMKLPSITQPLFSHILSMRPAVKSFT